MNKLWKSCERAIAKKIGGKRNPITGRQRGDVADIEHEILSPEIKHRNKLPGWLHDAMAQAIASVKKSEQTPIVILHEKGKDHDNDYLLIRLGDFCKIGPEEYLKKLREAGL